VGTQYRSALSRRRGAGGGSPSAIARAQAERAEPVETAGGDLCRLATLSLSFAPSTYCLGPPPKLMKLRKSFAGKVKA
jgi:hypothetical protein